MVETRQVLKAGGAVLVDILGEEAGTPLEVLGRVMRSHSNIKGSRADFAGELG